MKNNIEVILLTETKSPRSPLAQLVLFMICLSMAGAIIAGIQYVAVELPQQQILQTPTNGGSWGGGEYVCDQAHGCDCEKICAEFRNCIRHGARQDCENDMYKKQGPVCERNRPYCLKEV